MSVEELCKKAEKYANGGGFLHSLFSGGGAKYDEAAELYVQAANKAKMTKDWRTAAECYMKASYMHERGEDTYRQAAMLQEAGHALKRISADDAATPYNKAALLFANCGRFSQAAKMMKGIAETFEAEGDNYQALRYYKEAADYFDMDEYGKTQYTACILKWAELTALIEKKYTDAIKPTVKASIIYSVVPRQVFEREAEKASQSSLMQFGVKDYLLKAGILRIFLGDVTDMSIAVGKYESIDPRFANSLEGKLFKKLVAAYEEKNEELFVAAISEYDNITRLDLWRTHFLSGARENLRQLAGGVAQVDAEADSEGEIDLT